MCVFIWICVSMLQCVCALVLERDFVGISRELLST